MVQLEVGKALPAQWTLQKGFEGAIFEAADGFTLILGMPSLSQKERETLRKAKISVRTIEQDGLLLTLIRFGGTPIIFELNFDPTLYEDNRLTDLLKQVNTLQIIGVDTEDLTIQSLRLVSIPSKLLTRWNMVWRNALNEPDFSIRYNAWIDSLYARYSTVKLWDQAVYIGNLGDH